MGNSLRCCLACVLPCGALDLIRIVHLNGQVEEYSRPVAAKEVLDANPNHVISRPCSLQGASSHRIVIVSADAELKRGKIYFLIPASALPERKKRENQRRKSSTAIAARDRDLRVTEAATEEEEKKKKKEKKGHQRRQSGHAAVWKPNLESIYED